MYETFYPFYHIKEEAKHIVPDTAQTPHILRSGKHCGIPADKTNRFSIKVTKTSVITPAVSI
ncbi:hypothetical protein KY305_19020 [Bacillus sp. YC2]|uniref:hypothetical protein n=1 Tax=Bacillus sp. YC2 TaxID=2861287 RepID=UPI001CA6EBD6|nr:hypothetical protein [Bacillus sp. YC2]MBY8914817.1 hypothetical protein [Bacillus sp. YC2]